MAPDNPHDPDPAGPLRVVSLKNATAYPLHPSDDPHRMRLGVVDEHGGLLESTVDDRHQGTHLYLPPDPAALAPPDPIRSEAIYAGTFQIAFGHFLLESLQRLWWAVDHPELPVVWVAPHSTPAPELTAWQRDMLEIVGIRNEVLVLTRSARFDLLHVPEAGYKYADWSHPQHVRFLAAYDGPAQVPGSRLWLSRGKAWGGVTNRHIIERRLAARGWTIARFDAMSLRDQLDALARAEVVAGEEGSTFHNLLLLRDVGHKKFHIFRRHGPEHQSFRTIGDARQVDQEIHGCSNDAVMSVTGRRVERLAPNSARYLSHLGVPIRRPRPLPPDWTPGPSILRLNQLAGLLGAETFLQLGWRYRAAVTEVTVSAKDFVHDEFLFDVRGYRDPAVRFFEVTPQQFFTWFADGRAYDLVMITGEREWQEALELVRTVFATAAHDGTVVVLDHNDDNDDNDDRLRQSRRSTTSIPSWTTARSRLAAGGRP